MITISSCGVAKINLVLPENIEKDVMSSPIWHNYIPNFLITEYQSDIPELKVVIGNNNIKLTPHGIIYSSQDPVENIFDIVSLADYSFEHQRQAKGLYSIHGACISINSDAIVFFGGISGLGKSAVAKYISDSIPGAMFIADERVIINNNGYVVGGALGKMDAPIKGMDLSSSPPIRVALFIQPLLAGYKCSECKESFIWDEGKLSWHLYEELSRRVRGTARRIFNQSIPVESLDTAGISKNRSDFCNDISKKIKGAYIKGDLDFIKKMSLQHLKDN